MLTILSLLIGCMHTGAAARSTSMLEDAPADTGEVRAYNLTYGRVKAAEGKPEFAAMVALLEDMPCPEGTDCKAEIATLKVDDAAKQPHVVATRQVAQVVDDRSDDLAAVIGYRPAWLKDGLHLTNLSGAHAERVVIFKNGLPMNATDLLGVPSENVLVNISGDCNPEGPFPAIDTRYVQDVWVAARGSEQIVLYFVDHRGESLTVSTVQDYDNNTSRVAAAASYPIYEVITAVSHQVGSWGPGLYERSGPHGQPVRRPQSYC